MIHILTQKGTQVGVQHFRNLADAVRAFAKIKVYAAEAGQLLGPVYGNYLNPDGSVNSRVGDTTITVEGTTYHLVLHATAVTSTTARYAGITFEV